VDSLLEGWIEKTTADGKPYYYHAETKKTQWNKPENIKKESSKVEEDKKKDEDEEDNKKDKNEAYKKEDENDDSLPQGWVEKTTNDGKKYYYHAETKKTQWNKPENIKKESSKDDENDDSLPEGWVEKTTNDGRKYYYHTETKKAQWNKPEKEKEKKDEDDKEEMGIT
jgi:mRNA-degrading endonuclease HigB of HigAB toxin-antitoxin module